MGLQRFVFQKLVIISFGMFIVAADIEIVRNGINWIEARIECMRKGGKLSNEDAFGKCNNITKKTNIWIEPHQILSPWLGKIGCFDLGNVSTLKQRTGSVQECYPLCDKPYFGYINTFCFCIRTVDITPIAKSRCVSDYLSQNTTAWVYVANELNISNVDNLRYSGNCVGTRCINRSSVLEVFNCSSRKTSLCQRGTHSTQLLSWKGAEHFCNIDNTDLSVTNHERICNNTDDAVDNSDSYWTGYKRYWYKSTSNMSAESIHSLSEVFNCSYMSCPNERTTALHIQGNCSENLDGYACLINRIPENTFKEESSISINFTTRTKNKTTTESNTDTSNNQHEGHITSKQIVSSRESTIMNSATSATLEKLAKKSSYIVIIVVLTVVAVAIISSCVVLVICRVGRQGPFKRKEKETGSQMTEMHDPNYHDFENAPYNASSISHSNTAYNTHTCNGARYVVSDKTSNNMQSGTASNNEYSAVMKDKKSSSGANEYNFDQKEENSSDIMDNEYDRLNQIKNPCGNNNKNIYDSTSGLRDEYDPTYNTTSQISGRNKDENSVYDHT